MDGQAETTNKTIVNRLKKRLENVKGKWAEKLPNILWAYCWGLCPKIQFIGMSYIIKLFNYMRLLINELMRHYHSP